MDGTYQNPYNRAHIDSPLSPDTPQSASYRANVNRTKTRKWVEAKTQNYDGDDWGADDYDEPAPVPAVPPLRPSGSRQASYASSRLPSEPPMPSIVPQQHQHQPLAERPRDSGPPPALHIQTQPQAPPGGDLYAAGPNRATERRSSPQPDPYQRLQEGPSAESPKPLHDALPSRASDRSTPPLSQEPAAAYFAAYDQAQSARPNNQSPPPNSGAFGKAAAAPNLQETTASGRDAHGPGDAQAQPQHLLQEQPQPQSSADPNLTSDAPSSHQERPARDSDDQTGHATQPPQFAAYPDSSHAEETKRFSTSPQLPDLARMSMFGDDLFSGSANRFSSDAPPVPTLPEEPSSHPSPQHDKPSFSAAAVDAGAQGSTKSIDASPELPTSNMTTDAPQAKASPLPSPSPSPQPAAEPALAPPKPFRPSLPGDWVSDSVRSVDQGSYNERDPSVNEGSQKPSAGSSRDTDSDAGAGRSASPAVPVSSSSPETIRPSASSPNDFAGAGIHPVSTVQDDFAPPEVLNRQNTLSTIASPSPIKESDKLREEIIRTLSPVRPTHEPITTSQQQEPITEKEPVRESTYLHGVYDDYWTGGDDKPAAEPQTTEPESRSSNAAVVEPLPEIQPLSPRSPLRDPSADREYPSIDSRPRRFSWEGGAEDTGEDSDKETGPAAPKVQLVPVVDVGSTKPVELATSVVEPESESSVRGGSELPSRLAETARLNSQDDASQISHQVSQVSSLPRGGDQSFSAAPQPPSPVSVASEATPMAEPKSLALSDEKAIGSSTESAAPKIVTDAELQGLGASISPPHSSGPPSPHPAPQAPVKIMSFREILELPNAADRISKYDETRQQFAQMDSGLGNWLVNVKAQHPDHANASASFNGAYVPMPGTPHGLDQAPQQAAAGGGGAAPTQQPYYQQYLNASSPTTSSTPHAGRPLTGTLGGGSLPSASDFKHSSGQVGAKGKGLLLAAGKAGKGLLSKGKDKLRRDKNDEPSSPTATAPAAAASPQAPTQSKPDRRSSWALSLGGRTGTRDGAAGPPPPPQSMSHPNPSQQFQPQHQQQQQHHQHQHQRSVSDSAPQIPQPTRVSPFGTDVGQESQWQPPHQLQTQRNVAGHQRSDSLADELVSPVSDTHSLLGRDDPNDAARKPAAPPVAADEKIDDWVMVDSQRAAATGQVPAGAAIAAAPVAQAQPAQPDRRNSRAESPTKNNSFIGLPPIRRSSTFGLNYTRKAKERFSLDEDEMNDPSVPRSSYPGPSDTNTHTNSYARPPSQHGETRSRRGSGTLVNDAAIANAQARLQGHDTHAEDTLGGSSTLGPRNSHDSEEVDVGDDPEKKPIPVAPATLPVQNRTQRAVSEQQPRSMPPLGTVLPEGNPVQHVPPQGWNLQQSHLSAPLLSASRSRQFFTGPSSPGKPPVDAQQPAEPQQPEGNTPQGHVQQEGHQQPDPQQPIAQQPIAPQPIAQQSGPPQPAPDAPRQFAPQQPGPQNFGRPEPVQQKSQIQMPPRQKFSETPPSSARRYPGLFSGVAGGPGQQPPPGMQGFQGPPPPQLQQQLQQQQPAPGGPRRSSDLPPNMYQAPLGRQETLLQRTQSGEFQIPGIGPPEDDDRGRGRRSSGFFKEIGERFRSASRDRRTSMSEQRGPAPPQALPHQQSSMAHEIRPDDVSIISSNATEEALDKKKKRRSSFFMNLRGPRAAEDARDDAPSVSDTSSHPASGPGPQPIAPQDRRRSFFGVPTGSSNLGLPALSRSSTMSNANEPEGSISSQNTSKRRLSAMTGKLFGRSSSSQQDDQQQQHPKPGTSQSMAPSIQSRHSALANTQPAVPSPLAGPGRQRSDTAGSVPNMARVTTNASQMELPPPEDNRGRRVTGSFLGGLFNRSSSKTRENNAQPQRLQHQGQGPAGFPQGQFGPPQGPGGRGAPFPGQQQQFPQGPQQFAQGPQQFPQGAGGRGAPPQGQQQFPPGHPGLPRQVSGQGPPQFMQGPQQSQPQQGFPQGPSQPGPQGVPQAGRGLPQQSQPNGPNGPNGFAPGQQPWPRQESGNNQSPPPGAPRSVSGQGPPRQWSQSPNLNQQPPPFRTQGPPVHPIAGVSPPSRSPASFPDQERGGFQPPAKTSSPDSAAGQGRRVSHPYGPDDVQAPKSPVPEPETQAPLNGHSTNGQQAPSHFAKAGIDQTQEQQEDRQIDAPPALTQQVSVSPASSPEITSSIQPVPVRQTEQRTPEAEPARVDQPSTIASAGGLVVRQTQHPSIRKPTPTDRLSASPQPASAPQNQQASPQGPSATSSIYAGQDEPQPSVASSTPPAPQQQQQQPAPLGSNPVQRVSSGEQGPEGQWKPSGPVVPQQNGGPGPFIGQGRGQLMGQSAPQGPPQGFQGPQGQQSPPQGHQAFPQGPQGPVQGPQGPQGAVQGPQYPQGQGQGPQGSFQGPVQGPPGPGFPQGQMQGQGQGLFQGQFMGRGQGRGQGPIPGQMQGPGQFMGPSPPPSAPPLQTQTSGFRKLFRGKSEQPAQQAQGPRPPLQQQHSQMSQPPSQQQIPQQFQQQTLQAEKKEKSSGKSLFGAFKRSSKQPEPHGKQSPLPQQMGRGFPPPGPPGNGSQQTMGPQGPPQGPFNPQQLNMQGQIPLHVQQQMAKQNRPPPPPGFQYESPTHEHPQNPLPFQNQGVQGAEGPSIVQPTPQQPNSQQTPPEDRRGSPPYLQYQQQRISPANVPVLPLPGQKAPPLQQRGSFGPGPSPGLQQRQSFGPGSNPGQLQQRPSYGPGQGPMSQQQQGQNFPPNMGRGGPPPMQQFPPNGYREQQYEQVPIPKGYAAVHAEGSIVDPSPRAFSSPPARSQGQFPTQQGLGMRQTSQPPQLQQQQSWQQQPQQQYQQQQQPSPPAQFQGPQQGYQQVQGHQQVNQAVQQPGSYFTSQNMSQQQQTPPTQFQQGPQQVHQVQSQPLIQQQPQQHQHLQQQQQQQQQQQSPPLTHLQQGPHPGQHDPQSQVQPVPQQQQQHQQQQQQQPSIRPQGSITRKAPGSSVSQAPSQQVVAADEAPVKNGVKGAPEPTTPADSRLRVNVHKANQDEHNDIYDATPRKQPLERQRTGESQISISSTEEAARKANGAAKKSKGPPKVIRVNSTRAELEDTEDERKRSIRLEAQEEKILYDPNEDGPSSVGRRKEEADAPQMSATSYPGMEWNPYANGNYDYDD